MISEAQAPQALYDQHAASWTRDKPSSLSDYTARPVVFEMCGDVQGQHVLDLGCGEGYCARHLSRRGAQSILGIDVSSGMIAGAEAEEMRAPLGIRYRQGDATQLAELDDASFDLVIAVFLFNYLTTQQTTDCMQEIARVLRPRGRFVFSIPHPAFPFMRAPEPPFYFDLRGQTYVAARDTRFSGKIWKRDGSALEVQVVHKTFEDYFRALQRAGFRSLPEVRELTVTPEILRLDSAFFGPLADMPLHVAMSLER
jgi:SAM-dependent methyltransferase